jgi:hypothetical protein
MNQWYEKVIRIESMYCMYIVQVEINVSGTSTVLIAAATMCETFPTRRPDRQLTRQQNFHVTWEAVPLNFS